MDVCIWMYQDVSAREGGWDGVGCPHYQEVQPGEPTIVKEAALFPIFLRSLHYILNQDKRTTGYIIAYIEPQGLVHR